MSVEFSNAYQEILLDNLMAIIKQNFMFQTQLKLAENDGRIKAELQSLVNDLQNKLKIAEDTAQQVENFKAKANQNDSAHQEKTRIQTALNEMTKKFNAQKIALEEREKEVSELKNYIFKLEEIAPVSKLKKINLETKVEEEKPVIEEKPKDLFALQANDGSSF